jgi:hypothetical protein
MMSEIQSQPPVYQPGQIMNGHVWTGTEWVPVVQQPSTSGSSPWRMIGGIVALVVAAIAAIQGLSWIAGFADLDGQGNPFAGILALLGMGALAVAAGFGIAGIVLLTKKR